ncbi:MAG: selenocysteine-specific translation elongation factor [Defluviitaleaceae bacterium]|nr:selenocysteine-specific translation elongation factor [Defluviitaleaceae bacterium]
MKNIIIGTAGHIDHGKTSLIKALTGTSTDNLKEEIKRGISIDLGFTYFDLPSGNRAGIIDVPGHEKFLKNMLAGASGIDIVLLVIAANESVMPQTIEHIDILSYLNIKESIIVITKIDLVDEQMLDLVEQDIREKTKNTFVAKSPIIRVDSVKKIGINELVQIIDNLIREVPNRNVDIAPRLNIDRVFSLKGFGTIVTGTLVEGKINVNEEMVIYPHNFKTKIRGIKIHGKDVKTAFAGQRTAVNISNIKTEQIKRGCILATSESMLQSSYIDVKISIIKNTDREIKFWERVRVYLGTREVLARLVIMDKISLKSGETGYCQLRMEEPVTVKRNDPFVLRLFSPLETIGGGIILDPVAKKHGRKKEILQSLILKEKGDNLKIAEEVIEKNIKITSDDLMKYLVVGEDELAQILTSLNDRIIRIGSFLYHSNILNSIKENIVSILENYHTNFPLKFGIKKEELRTKLFITFNNKDFGDLITILQNENVIKLEKNLVSKYDFKIKYDGKNLKIKNEIEKIILDSKYNLKTIEEVTLNKKDYTLILESLLEQNIIKIDENILISKKYYDSAKELLINFIQKNKSITLAEFRDLIGSSRKYALSLLEDFDKKKITKMIDGKRFLID